MGLEPCSARTPNRSRHQGHPAWSWARLTSAVARTATAAFMAAALVASQAVPSAAALGVPTPRASAHGARVLEARTGQAAGTDVTLTTKTIVVPPALVRSSLSSVSASGSTYTFSSATGPLSQIAKGKVLLLEGRDAIVVTSVKHAGKSLVVGAAPASLTDVVQSGTIKVAGAPDASAAVGVPLSTSAFGAPAVDGLSVGAPYSPAPSTGERASRNVPAGATFAYKGSSGNFTYKVKVKGIAGGLDGNLEICYTAYGSKCGSGLSINVILDGVFTWSSQDLDVDVGGGSVSSGSFSISGLSTNVKLNYTVLRGTEPNVGAKPPVFKIPFAFEMPLCGSPIGCAGIPLYSKFEFAILITLGIAAKNSSVEGGVDFTLGGSASVSGSKLGGATGSATGTHLKGNFITGTALTLASSGILVAVQNKFGVGLGIKNINGLYYISEIAAVGETTGSLVAGMSCVAYDGDFTITGNFEAQLFGFTVASPAKTLFDKKVSFKQPGC
ncbi:MAG TPA: hypothetical protein VME46_23985 [Acidimicrobiales bacterium]|nr:hypothetical protein [Acidimicrobiales bacterium]